MENFRNQNDIGENELLVVSFGTSSADSRCANIGAVEQAIEEAVRDQFSVRRCFTSQMIINIVKKRDDVVIDNVSEALDRAVSNGVRTLVVQPTHIMKGFEYDKLQRILSGYDTCFDRIVTGEPLLTSEEDFSRVADAIHTACSDYDDGETAFVLMGHGTDADSNAVYKMLQNVMDSKGMKKFYIGTVEAEPSIEDVIRAVDESDCRRVVLRPLMLVAGNHAVNDMASADDPESWYSRFRKKGYEVECIIEGMGQIASVRDIYVDHALNAISLLNEC